MEELFKSLCSVLPDNYNERLKALSELLKDGGEQLSKLISSSPAKINEKIISYLIVKLCYNDSDTSLVRCRVMDDLTCTQQIRYGTYVHKYVCIHTCMYESKSMPTINHNNLIKTHGSESRGQAK